jgi:hypothetical protein
MFKGGGKWSSNGCDGKKRSGGFIDVNGGVSKGGSLIVTHYTPVRDKDGMTTR